MSESTCYYYDEQRNRCDCYVNENLNELLAENAKLREQIASFRELSQDMVIFAGPIMGRHFARRLRELGVEVDDGD